MRHPARSDGVSHFSFLMSFLRAFDFRDNSERELIVVTELPREKITMRLRGRRWSRSYFAARGKAEKRSKTENVPVSFHHIPGLRVCKRRKIYIYIWYGMVESLRHVYDGKVWRYDDTTLRNYNHRSHVILSRDKAFTVCAMSRR